MPRLPNLFHGAQRTASAQRLYEMFLSRLHFAGFNDRTLSACREIRRYAGTAGRKRVGAFTYFWELQAYGDKQDFESMWRVLRAQEQASRGKLIHLNSHQWTHREHNQLIFSYAPLLYLRERYRLGCNLMEIALEMSSHRKGWAFDWLWHVFRPVKVPTGTHEVALSHFYSALGLDLSQWQLWKKFLDDFDPQLFRRSGISRDALSENSNLVKPFFQWIVTERRKRLFSGTADGERDLVEPPSKVRSRQSGRKRMMLKFDSAPGRDLFEKELQQLFPELADLPSQLSLKQLLRSKRR